MGRGARTEETEDTDFFELALRPEKASLWVRRRI
jgi:hypothetical protein